MFEHRLGLALGKSIEEVRSLPFDEYESWQTFYLLEPWGWHDREYRTAILLAMLLNTNVDKANRKSVNDFVRDMPKAIAGAYLDKEREYEKQEKYRKASKEERAKLIARSIGVK